MDEAERCSRVHLMELGKLIAEGEPGDLLKKEGVRSFDELFISRSVMKHE
jgi:ABC-type multidrug transport system ATPase subunit